MSYTDSIFVLILVILVVSSRLLQILGRRGLIAKEILLTLISWVIIATWGVFDLLLFLTVAGVNFAFAEGISRSKPGRAAYLLGGAIIADIATLAFFKYSHTFSVAFSPASREPLPIFSFGIPLAISFYTFHIVSYLVDLKNGHVSKLKLKDYLFYLSFFPHVIAGPIIRAWQLAPQIGRRLQSNIDLVLGFHYFVVGFALKSVAADNIGAAIDPYWTPAGIDALLTVADYWAVAFLYYCQIYSDFAGYSLMAMGMARLLGYKFPINFRSPMLATDLRSFWRHWHITLSRWLRDYLYIPLGGNRAGRLRITVNLIVTMLLGGMWHGAGLSFVIWGAMHGVGLVVNRWMSWIGGRYSPRWLPLSWLLCQMWVTLAWVFFRSPSVDFALKFIVGMEHVAGTSPWVLNPAITPLFIFAILPIAHQFAPFLIRRNRSRHLAWTTGMATGICLLLASAVASPVKTFIYFRF